MPSPDPVPVLWEAVTAGRNWMNSYTAADFDRAIALFRKAIAWEPKSALAHAHA